MLSILWLLKSGRKMTAQQLADELEIHIRTVYRCIDALCASGVPIVAESGHHGGYRIMEHFSREANKPSTNWANTGCSAALWWKDPPGKRFFASARIR